ncbi:GNAT family N-acetyltransferase [Paraflavitalea sp. CAU 1676]|uniref:GNAT family N-acetyltransferase n=1 Tax=Paraflavitalea sp. CAU 1676 TaxID=3032598 RepID=UPI0023DAC949|nr:GNAT family N-acetyltransferase [Paraflavitalea sp. CAU 1676]MDF2188907.1 GNAT family N-acetyltransferase [Paraflavitalea sp. CAU 1676]
MSSLTLNDITIRTTLQPGDIGYVVYLHGHLYSREYNYGLSFETYVAEGLVEFYRQYDATRDRVWIAEHNDKMIGFLLLMHRGEAAQLRYYVLDPACRGIGLGKKLMGLFMEFLQEAGYTSAYLWTTNELPAAASLYKKNGFVLVEERPATARFEKNVTEQKYEWRREA